MNSGTVCVPAGHLHHPTKGCSAVSSVSSGDPFLSHYTLDRMGRRMLVGLSFDETTEFERLDASISYDRKPRSASAMVPLERTEIRWLELYRKHRTAFEAMQNKPV